MKNSKNAPYKKYEKEKLELDNDIFSNEDNRRGRPEFFMPAGTEVLKLQEYLEIDVGRRSKNKKFRGISTLFTAGWNMIILFVFYLSVIDFVPIGILFSSLFLLIGSYLMLQTLKSYINTKKVIIEKGKITVSEKPITLLTRFLEIPTDKITQLYTSKYFTGVTVNNNKIMAYSLSAVTDENRVIRLVDESNLETVLYLEQEIERFLDIEDKDVHGEILDHYE